MNNYFKKSEDRTSDFCFTETHNKRVQNNNINSNSKMMNLEKVKEEDYANLANSNVSSPLKRSPNKNYTKELKALFSRPDSEKVYDQRNFTEMKEEGNKQSLHKANLIYSNGIGYVDAENISNVEVLDKVQKIELDKNKIKRKLLLTKKFSINTEDEKTFDGVLEEFQDLKGYIKYVKAYVCCCFGSRKRPAYEYIYHKVYSSVSFKKFLKLSFENYLKLH